MEFEARKVNYKGMFKTCPECGYDDGFHSMFQERGGKRKWLLICPECHKVFDIGLEA